MVKFVIPRHYFFRVSSINFTPIFDKFQLKKSPSDGSIFDKIQPKNLYSKTPILMGFSFVRIECYPNHLKHTLNVCFVGNTMGCKGDSVYCLHLANTMSHLSLSFSNSGISLSLNILLSLFLGLPDLFLPFFHH